MSFKRALNDVTYSVLFQKGLLDNLVQEKYPRYSTHWLIEIFLGGTAELPCCFSYLILQTGVVPAAIDDR